MIRLSLRVRRSDAELVLADLLELAPSGVEEIDLHAEDGGERIVEYAVYGAPGELPLLPDVRAAAGGALVDISTSEVADDWSERWKQFHQPVLIEARAEAGAGHHCLFVRPPWEALSDRADALEIVIDPAQAFGTGAHATTRMCLELLLELTATEGARDPVLDVGSGSGVLAIAALKLGYSNVLALDNDRESVRAILANAAVNDVELEARCFDLRRESLPWLVGDEDLRGVPVVLNATSTVDRSGPANGQVVLANLLRPLLIDLAGKMAQPFVPAPPERLDLIASGLLREQADEVAEVFARRLGLSERARLEQGEWSALWLTRRRAGR